MNNIVSYDVYKDNKIIKTGLCPTWYIHGMLSSVLEKDNADYIKLAYKSGKKIIMYSPRVLYTMKPDTVSQEDHQVWFSGNRYNL